MERNYSWIGCGEYGKKRSEMASKDSTWIDGRAF
jgi:hypothetical protein